MLESQKKASKKWDKQNKKRVMYIKDRSGAFSFVNPSTKAKKERFSSQADYIDDLKKLRKVVEEKLGDHNA